jgi:hypothetical protein
MTILRTFVAALAISALTQSASAAPADEWKKSAVAADAAYWQAYNRADPDGMNAFLDDDVEFYHDRGGTLTGKAALSQANEAMRGAPPRLRREAVPGTVQFAPMRKGDELYGVLVSGEHRFYLRADGKPDAPVGRARFTQLMLLKDGQWRLSRIFSYEHADAPVKVQAPRTGK